MERPFVEEWRRCGPGGVKNVDFWRFFRPELFEMRLLCLETSDLTRTIGVSLVFNCAFKPCTQMRMPKNELVQGSYSEPRVSRKSTLKKFGRMFL